jgi:hypothetical protein
MLDLMAITAEDDAFPNLAHNVFTGQPNLDHIGDIEILLPSAEVMKRKCPVVGEAASTASQRLFVIVQPLT